MAARVIAAVAVLVWLGVSVGCLVNAPSDAGAQTRWTDRSNPPPISIGSAERAATLPFRGVAMTLHGIALCDPNHPDSYYKSVDEIAALGADTVKFVVAAAVENKKSTRIYIDQRSTPDAKALGDLIKYAKGKKLRVVLMPIVLVDRPIADEWRGQLEPLSWEAWFESYRQMIQHYATVAEATGVDLLVIGSELVSTEKYGSEWLKVIQVARSNFKGMLTYSSNWDHFKDIPFWDHLDVIGMNSYWKMGNDRNVSIEEVVQRWQKIQENVLGFARMKGKPLVLLEVGWCSISNAADEPWDYTKEYLQQDLELQRKLWEGFFKAWHGKKGFGGFMVWEWTPGNRPPEDKSYTPENKPAEKVIREYFAKPGWEAKW